jgi:single-stranded DNA-specific DHH superfamily exonuclease
MNVVTKYHKPVMIGRRNNRNEIQGSIRSDGNFAGLPSFKKFLEESGLVTYTAGHDNAAGWGLNGDKLDALINYANKKLKAEDFENCYVVDYILDGSDYIDELLGALASHPEYFGNHIDEAYVVVKNIPLMNIMAMGTNKDSMKISYNGIDYVKFKDLDFVDEITKNRTKKLTVYGRANLNEWMGKQSIQVFISDYELVEDTSKYEF